LQWEVRLQLLDDDFGSHDWYGQFSSWLSAH
jgi:hypothetical protein